jgi:calcineurin-like phosphoesterase family protein
MKKTYVVSNTLFNDDENIYKLIETWNSVINKTDDVYICGNFAVEPVIFTKLLKMLNGTKCFITGEFDEYVKNFANIEDISILEDIVVLDKYKVVLSFWPLRNWPNKNRDYVHIYGFDSGLIEVGSKTGSCAINEKFGNKPIELTFYKEILTNKL